MMGKIEKLSISDCFIKTGSFSQGLVDKINELIDAFEVNIAWIRGYIEANDAVKEKCECKEPDICPCGVCNVCLTCYKKIGTGTSSEHTNVCEKHTEPCGIEEIVVAGLKMYFKEHMGVDDFGCEGCDKHVKALTFAIKEHIRYTAEGMKKPFNGTGFEYTKMTAYNQALEELVKELTK